MKRDYVLIDTKKIPEWIRWIFLIFGSNIIFILMGVFSLFFIAYRFGFDANSVLHIAYFIIAAVILTFVYDFAPRFKLFFSISWSIVFTALFIGTSLRISYPLNIISTLVEIAAMIIYVVFLYKKN